LSALQSVNSPISFTFNGWTYSGNVKLAGVTEYPTVALKVYTALNHHRPVLAQTTGDTIQSEQTDFTGTFTRAQFTVDSVQSGTVEIGGILNGAGIVKNNLTSSQVIYQHLNQGGTAGGPGSYSTSGRLGQQSTPEPIVETYGILTIGSVKSGAVVTGSELIGPGVPGQHRDPR
jgi:hypothetical protein